MDCITEFQDFEWAGLFSFLETRSRGGDIFADGMNNFSNTREIAAGFECVYPLSVASAQQRLGGLLLEMGFIDQEQLRVALDRQEKSGKRLGKILVESGLITEDRLVHALSRQLGIEACDPIMTPIHDSVLALVPPGVAFTHRVLPVARQRDNDGECLYVATADPLDSPAQAALVEVVPGGTELRWMLAGETEMDLALARHYGAAPPSFTESQSTTDALSLMENGEPLQDTGDILTALREAVELSRDIPQKPPRPAGGGLEVPRSSMLQGVLSDDLAQQISEVEALLEDSSGSTGWSMDIPQVPLNGRASASEPSRSISWPGFPSVSRAGLSSESNRTEPDLGLLAAEAAALPVADVSLGFQVVPRPMASDEDSNVDGKAKEVRRASAGDTFPDTPTSTLTSGRAQHLHEVIREFVRGAPLDWATRDDILRAVTTVLWARGELSEAKLKVLFSEDFE